MVMLFYSKHSGLRVKLFISRDIHNMYVLLYVWAHQLV